jgi:hypothetical protein
VINENDPKNAKHPKARISTLRGINIDRSDENENAYESMCLNCEFDSKLIDESDSQFVKQ